MIKQRLFIDIDGTLNVWSTTATFYDIHQKGYFLSRPAHQNIIKAITLLDKHFEIYSLSAILSNEYAISEKDIWLNQYTEISLENRIYVPYGESKSKYIKNPRKDDILLDDFSINLHEWHGIGIKVKNGINGTHGTWKGYEINVRQNPEIIANMIRGIAFVNKDC